MDKNIARVTGLANRKHLSEKDRVYQNTVLFNLLKQKLADYRVIGIYVSIGNEVPTHDLIKWALNMGKIVCVPKVTGSTLEFYILKSFQDLVPSIFHLLEPANCEKIAIEEIEIMLVPLSAFDKFGNRTGYGKGYYDSILSKSKYNVGIAYACQMMDKIDCDPWDIPLDEVITG